MELDYCNKCEADEIDRYLEDFAIFSGKPL